MDQQIALRCSQAGSVDPVTSNVEIRAVPWFVWVLSAPVYVIFGIWAFVARFVYGVQHTTWSPKNRRDTRSYTQRVRAASRKYRFKPPKIGRVSDVVRQVQDDPASGQVLELFYRLRSAEIRTSLSWFEWFVANTLPMIASVQNRAARVRQEVTRIMHDCSSNGNKSVAFIALAAGPAGPLLRGVRDGERWSGLVCAGVFLTDLYRRPLELAKSMINDLGIRSDVELMHGLDLREPRLVQEAILAVVRRLPGGVRVVVEVIGWPDYPSNEQVSRFLSAVYDALPPGSFLLTGNVLRSPRWLSWLQRLFIENVFRWMPMHYRTVSEFKGIVTGAGFLVLRESIDPNRGFVVVTAQK